MTKLSLLNHELVVTEERERYNDIRLLFQSIAEEMSLNFEKIYNKNNKSLDDVSKYAYGQGSECIAVSIGKAIEILIQNEIFHIDQNDFVEKYYSKYHTWDDDFGEINDKYMEIVLEGQQLDAYRKARREGRGRLVGGGFGLSGAAKGILTAGAVNMAFGAVHGVFNGMGKIISSISASIKKIRYLMMIRH